MYFFDLNSIFIKKEEEEKKAFQSLMIREPYTLEFSTNTKPKKLDNLLTSCSNDIN